MKLRYLLWFIAALLLNVIEAPAQITSLPEQAMGARAFALGQSASLTFSDALAVSLNPSSIHYAETPTLSAFYTKWPEETDNFSGGVVYPTAAGRIGLSFFRITTDVDVRDDQGNFLRTSSFQQSHLLLTYGTTLLNRFVVGANAKFVSRELGEFSSPVKNIGFDFAAQYWPGLSHPLFQNLRFGISIDNLVKPALNLTEERTDLSREIRLIVEDSFNWSGGTFVLLGNVARYRNARDEIDYDLHAGMEYRYRGFALRGGYRDDFVAIGIGLQLKFFSFDYAFGRLAQSPASTQHAFSLSFELPFLGSIGDSSD